ncbi:MAG: MBL fold metallo-hydrolase [Spirochaetales bacterium]|nr:MBL fold metallo-hydrolase [Spirochaetales bacterium]
MRITLLGTGTSHGIPVASCGCSVCTSEAEENKRYRCSLWVEVKGSSLIIDTSPEFRLQTVRSGIRDVDGVLITHAHADHLHGIDDLRPFGWKKKIPIWAKQDVCDEVEARFPYIFRAPLQEGGGTPDISMNVIDPSRPFTVAGVTVTPLPVLHGKLEIMGYRIGSMAYITDCSAISPKTESLLQNLDTIVLGALRYKTHETHFSIPEALAFIKKISPGRAYLTHFSHDVDHFQLKADLPEGVEPAWDGLTITIPD